MCLLRWCTYSCPNFYCKDLQELLDRFRPNLIVKTQKAFEEENWTSVQIGSQVFVVSLEVVVGLIVSLCKIIIQELICSCTCSITFRLNLF